MKGTIKRTTKRTMKRTMKRMSSSCHPGPGLQPSWPWRSGDGLPFSFLTTKLSTLSNISFLLRQSGATSLASLALVFFLMVLSPEELILILEEPDEEDNEENKL